MLRALYTSSNSLLDQQTSIDCISSNVANVNTVGFKKTRATFEDILSQTIQHGTISKNPMQVGLGAKLASTDTIMNQGEILPTENPTDVAMEGDGFFTVLNPTSKQDEPSYLFTRAGNFTFDAEDNLVAANGDFVVGWLAQQNENGYPELQVDENTHIPTTPIQAINIKDYHSIPAIASTHIKFKANLNGGNDIKEFTKVSPNANTDFNILLNQKGEDLNIKNGDNFQISYDGGTTWHTYTYSPSPAAGEFSTLDELVNLMQTDIGSNAKVSVEDGKITITNNSSSNLNIKVQSATQDNDTLLTMLASLSQTVQPNSSIASQTFNVPSHTVESTFYDINGNKHKIDITFKKTQPNKWSYTVTLPDNDGTIANNTGSVEFDNDGGLNQNTKSPTVSITLQGQTEPMNLLINLWNTEDGNYQGNKYSGLTQFALPSGTSYQTQDGSPAGEIKKVSIDQDGNINASYSNGKTVSIAKLAISHFTNPQGLKRVGDTMFAITANVDPQDVIESKGYIGVANQGGRGSVLSSKLEMSNVDLAEEFTDMIVFQRGFQANAKGVTTADEIIQTAIQLKR